MTILKGFDFDELRRNRARRAASGGVDLVQAIGAISPDIEKLKVGDTAQIAIPKDVTTRKFVMQITAKLNNLVPAGAPWAGRDFKVAHDGQGNVYVQRGEDVKTPVTRKRRQAGTTSGKTSVAASGAKVTENA
jgi:hypothetical protein